MMRIADEVVMSPFDDNSMLSPMHYHYARYNIVPITIL